MTRNPEERLHGTKRAQYSDATIGYSRRRAETCVYECGRQYDSTTPYLLVKYREMFCKKL